MLPAGHIENDFEKTFNKAKLECISTGRWDALRALECDEQSAIAFVRRRPEEIEYLLWIKKLPFAALDLMARIGNHSDKMRIALKYPLHRATYDYLSEQDEEVKIRLYGNKKLPEDIQYRLLNDRSEYVRHQTARWRAWMILQKKR